MANRMTFYNGEMIESKQLPDDQEPKPNEEQPTQEQEDSEEDLQGLADSAMAALGYAEPEQKEKPKQKEDHEEKVQEEGNEEGLKPAEKPDEDKPKEVAKGPEDTEAGRKRLLDEAAETFASKVHEAIKRDQPVEEQQKTKSPVDEHGLEDDQDTHTREVVKVMAENAKFKDLPARFETFIEREKEYRTQWEKENAGQQYDPSSDDHADFYDRYGIQWPENEFIKAEAKLEVRRELQSAKEADRKEREELARERQRKQSVEDASKSAKQSVIDRLSNDYDLKPEEIESDDKLARLVISNEDRSLRAQVQAIEDIFKGGAEPDRNNEHHASVFNFINEQEGLMGQLDPSETIRGGLRFAPLDKYSSMPTHERARHWTLWSAPDVVRELLTNETAEKTYRQITELRAGPPQRGAANKTQVQKQTPEATDGEMLEPTNTNRNPNKPRSVNTGSSSDKTNNENPNLKGGEDWVDSIGKGLF